MTVATATPPRPTNADPEDIGQIRINYIFLWGKMKKLNCQIIWRTLSSGLCHPSIPRNCRGLGLNPRLRRQRLLLVDEEMHHFLDQLYFLRSFIFIEHSVRLFGFFQIGEPGWLEALPMLRKDVHLPLQLHPQGLRQGAQEQQHRQLRQVDR